MEAIVLVRIHVVVQRADTVVRTAMIPFVHRHARMEELVPNRDSVYVRVPFKGVTAEILFADNLAKMVAHAFTLMYVHALKLIQDFFAKHVTLCSYHSPCFPGTCSNSVNCQCYQGFSGQNGSQRCKTMTSRVGPTITRCTSVLANIERTGQKREKYRFMTDSSEPNSTRVDTLWLNQKDYNYINVEFSAFYTGPDNLAVPEYVEQFKFGIVSGKIQIDLRKIDRNDPNNPFVSQSQTKNCTNQPGSLNPNDDVFHCNFTDENFDRLLESGDNLTLTVIAENGGFRELKSPSTQLKDLFIGHKTTKSTMFRFDFEKPHHCLQKGSCMAKVLDVIEDITKSPITFIWNNWIDDLSGIQGYKLQVYLLKPNTTYLTEPYPWNPLQEISFNKTKSNYRYLYTPRQAGMYSFILNVIDNANNTQYARTLVLYDPSSNITLSTSPFFATSAEPETNYKWQNNLENNITMSWKGHFENKFHHENKLLNQVARYQHFDHMTKYEKQVPQKLDDNTGNRTLQSIQNIRGIVKFEYFFTNGNSDRAPEKWSPVTDMFSESQTFFKERKDGDAINFWVRATDVMGNEKVDLTKIFFDSTPPVKLEDSDVKITLNIKSATYAFSSRFQIETFDRDSGIHKIHLELVANSSNKLFHKSDIQGNKSNIDVRKEGYRIPMGDFYYFSHHIDINNCWMVVSKEKFSEEFVLLNLTVYNNAMETTHYSRTFTDLASLDGIDEYIGPVNLSVIATYDNSVRLKWVVSPTCYERSKIILQFRSSSGQTETRFIDKDADWVDLTGLDPETSYNLSFVTEYGRQRSDPVFLNFKTIESPAALTVGAIAGMSTAFLILLGVIVAMVVLWRLGRLSVVRNDIRRRMTEVRKNISNRFSANPDNDIDDIYIYGQMELNNTDRWILPSSDIVLDALLTSGRFADIYKARYQKQNNKAKQIVVAKTLKSGYSEENLLMMRAKINFFGKEVGEHPNIIHFIGSVIDNDAFGPYMVFEYCTRGQLRDWLLQQKNESTEEIVELLYRIVYGISKGMYYLETKKIVHRRLAARNVLLSEELEPQIYGFGPEPQQQQSTEDDGGGTSEEKERIPVKWTAPECFVSMKTASTKSDVWSFGVVLWEVFSLGETPYPGIRSRDVQAQVRNGHRMNRPEFANDFYYGIMRSCWNTKPRRRPCFKDISTDIGKTFSTVPSDEYYYYCEKGSKS
ncbi:uncharacterized protein LOC133178201 [Saccostrea echinata]|uniref:uncharacterized protein LOC133178201 n=1 Tax=Saccostrea echinata TaxID=191078 RepID=UPI002A7FE87F|nr:uncharacterized protein LOC133178201 [Saccostrea echinata]